MRRIIAVGATIGAILAGGSAALAEPADAWRNVVYRLIASHQNYPRSAELRHQEGTTRLQIALAANGRVAGVDVVESSGSPILDLEARATISNIGKLPPPPAGITKVTIAVVWRLE